MGNAIDEHLIGDKKFDIYYINRISKNINLNFISRYKKITIVEPFFGNIIERLIREKKYLKNEILTISYNETILHKYGNKSEQDFYLGFDNLSVIKKIKKFNAQ